MNEVEVIKRSRGRAEIWFPGRWAGGGALILGPLLLLAGVALRSPFHFFFPQQLEAFRDHPALMTASYSLFAAGNLLLWPAVLTLVRLIGGVRPYWAMWGGIFAICGLFARTFHAGVDHLAFQLVPRPRARFRREGGLRSLRRVPSLQHLQPGYPAGLDRSRRPAPTCPAR
ncbi:hypothetical protein LJK88_09090 [Paenibacillus sp. P26]|nr:hypothetical protein LJK88_09090 [Paenibacillus sp. P26]